MTYKRYRKGVFCVVYALPGPRYLLLHRKLHWCGWEFPKGGKKGKERLENTLKREVKEETGLNIIKMKRFPVHGKFLYDKKTRQEWKAIGFSYVLFTCQVKKAKPKISKREHDKYRWCSYAQAMKLLKWPSQRKSLRIINKFIKQSF